MELLKLAVAGFVLAAAFAFGIGFGDWLADAVSELLDKLLGRWPKWLP